MINRYIVPLFLIVLLLLSLMYCTKALLHKAPVEEIAEKGQQSADTGVEEKALEQKRDYTDAVEKNIFHPERRYVETSGEMSAEVDYSLQTTVSDLTVKGIVQRPDGEFVAYISRGGEKARPVHAGDSIENIKVVSITRSDVTIRLNDKDITLSLKKVKTIDKKGK